MIRESPKAPYTSIDEYSNSSRFETVQKESMNRSGKWICKFCKIEWPYETFPSQQHFNEHMNRCKQKAGESKDIPKLKNPAPSVLQEKPAKKRKISKEKQKILEKIFIRTKEGDYEPGQHVFIIWKDKQYYPAKILMELPVENEVLVEVQFKNKKDRIKVSKASTFLRIPNQHQCHICKSQDNRGVIMTCQTCKKKYHNCCFSPPLKPIQDLEWVCPNCSTKKSLAEESIIPLYPDRLKQAGYKIGDIVWARSQNSIWWPATLISMNDLLLNALDSEGSVVVRYIKHPTETDPSLIRYHRILPFAGDYYRYFSSQSNNQLQEAITLSIIHLTPSQKDQLQMILETSSIPRNQEPQKIAFWQGPLFVDDRYVTQMCLFGNSAGWEFFSQIEWPKSLKGRPTRIILHQPISESILLYVSVKDMSRPFNFFLSDMQKYNLVFAFPCGKEKTLYIMPSEKVRITTRFPAVGILIPQSKISISSNNSTNLSPSPTVISKPSGSTFPPSQIPPISHLPPSTPSFTDSNYMPAVVYPTYESSNLPPQKPIIDKIRPVSSVQVLNLEESPFTEQEEEAMRNQLKKLQKYLRRKYAILGLSSKYLYDKVFEEMEEKLAIVTPKEKFDRTLSLLEELIGPPSPLDKKEMAIVTSNSRDYYFRSFRFCKIHDCPELGPTWIRFHNIKDIIKEDKLYKTQIISFFQADPGEVKILQDGGIAIDLNEEALVRNAVGKYFGPFGKFPDPLPPKLDDLSDSSNSSKSNHQTTANEKTFKSSKETNLPLNTT